MNGEDADPGRPEPEREPKHAPLAAFEALCLTARPIAVAIARRAVSDHDAEDVAQDLLLELWKQWNADPAYFAEPGSLEQWVVAVAKHDTLDLLKAEERRDERQYQFAAAMERVLHQSTHPELIAQAREREDDLDRALRALPKRRREAVLLVRADGLSHEEAGEKMHISPETVHRHVCLALADLREALAHHLGPHDDPLWRAPARPRQSSSNEATEADDA